MLSRLSLETVAEVLQLVFFGVVLPLGLWALLLLCLFRGAYSLPRDISRRLARRTIRVAAFWVCPCIFLLSMCMPESVVGIPFRYLPIGERLLGALGMAVFNFTTHLKVALVFVVLSAGRTHARAPGPTSYTAHFCIAGISMLALYEECMGIISGQRFFIIVN